MAKSKKGEKSMIRIDYASSAAALYDGGWRANDKEQLIKEYELSEEDAELICERLAEFEYDYEHEEEIIPLF